MNATEIKALGPVWGSQGGLLSRNELAILMALVRDEPGDELLVLEVGHYYGLSTCGLVHSLRARDGAWSLTSVDAHIPDPWVSPPAAVDAFESNRTAHFDDPRLTVRYEWSQSIDSRSLFYDVVMYDGDHGAEQQRFTREVIKSDRPSLFVFDDRDFEVPLLCSAELIAAGWRDESPICRRAPGDKRAPETMTLGIFRR